MPNQKVRTSKVKGLRTQKVQTQTSSQKKFSKELPSNLARELKDLTSLFIFAKWEGQDQETANNATQTTQETEKGSTNLLNSTGRFKKSKNKFFHPSLNQLVLS